MWCWLPTFGRLCPDHGPTLCGPFADRLLTCTDTCYRCALHRPWRWAHAAPSAATDPHRSAADPTTHSHPAPPPTRTQPQRPPARLHAWRPCHGIVWFGPRVMTGHRGHVRVRDYVQRQGFYLRLILLLLLFVLPCLARRAAVACGPRARGASELLLACCSPQRRSTRCSLQESLWSCLCHATPRAFFL